MSVPAPTVRQLRVRPLVAGRVPSEQPDERPIEVLVANGRVRSHAVFAVIYSDSQDRRTYARALDVPESRIRGDHVELLDGDFPPLRNLYRARIVGWAKRGPHFEGEAVTATYNDPDFEYPATVGITSLTYRYFSGDDEREIDIRLDGMLSDSEVEELAGRRFLPATAGLSSPGKAPAGEKQAWATVDYVFCVPRITEPGAPKAADVHKAIMAADQDAALEREIREGEEPAPAAAGQPPAVRLQVLDPESDEERRDRRLLSSFYLHGIAEERAGYDLVTTARADNVDPEAWLTGGPWAEVPAIVDLGPRETFAATIVCWRALHRVSGLVIAAGDLAALKQARAAAGRRDTTV